MEKKENEEEAGGGVDKISDLPDSILHHIFSFLNMEEAVRSSVYSKRWRHLWISLPTLNFDYDSDDISYYKNHNINIQDLVDKVLILRDCSPIQRFSLICSTLSRTAPVNTWIVSALRRSNLQELVLEIFFEQKISPLPTCIFNSKSLTLLKLVSYSSFKYFTLPLPDHSPCCLPSLKTLFLDTIEFVDEYKVNKFFSSSCPVLESLTITDSWFRDININISSLSLKHLAIEDIFGSDSSSVGLKTPNLISFRCKDYMTRKYYLENISSLIKADICMVQKYEDKHIPSDDQVKEKRRMFKFLGACYNVEDLTLSATILEAISYPCFLESNLSAITCPCFLHSNPTGFCNLRCLEIDASFSGDCISAITCLLKISPTIETLIVNRPQRMFDLKADHDMVTYQGEVSFPSLLDKLEHVEIRDAIGCGNELKFLEILLKNAKVLTNLVVHTRSEDLVDRSVRMKKFTKLLKFPRASSNVAILFI